MSEENANSASKGSGKSEAEVAFELLNKLKGQGVWGERNLKDILDMYAECLDAAKGFRAYQGQNRVDVPVKTVGTAPARQATPAQAAPVQAPQAATAQAPAPAPAQPVHVQQQALAQAYNPNQ
ncbi:hypothetical protein ACJ3XI_07995 [Litorimonas sp. RW-G-Af-16]|uniref:hypothetical protein n=1 Tax=Litorimonas sp. RW-G-Af-16 TaxID=3241168 RepID=UPI00390CB5B9